MIKASLASWFFQRSTALLIAPIILLCALRFYPANVSTFILLNFLVFFHIHFGLKEILADYIHHNVTRNLLFALLQIIIIIAMKNAFVLFVRVF